MSIIVIHIIALIYFNPMNFDNIHADCECNCIEGAILDSKSMFAIKTNKDTIRTQDFISHWERNMRPESNECNEICSSKGKSISILNKDSDTELKEIYKNLFKISPGYKPFFTVIRFNENCGLLKASPLDYNPYHFDFYKCDDFQVERIELITCSPLFEEIV